MNEHLCDRRLIEYLHDTLSPADRDQVDIHLKTCTACQHRLDTFSATAEVLTDVLQVAGRQVTPETDRSWHRIWEHRKKQRISPLAAPFTGLARHAATLGIVLLMVAGVAGLLHTLAVTGPASDQTPPTPTLAPSAAPISVPSPLPYPSNNGRIGSVSILILGPDAEDTPPHGVDALILLTIDAQSESALALWIPSDLYVEPDGLTPQRVGDIVSFEDVQTISTSLELTRRVVSDTLRMPIHHTVLVHPQAFIELVDAIGGVDIDVPHPIDDRRFPGPRGTFEPFSISAGAQHLDGSTALHYARTQAIPVSGFDRTARQKQLVLALGSHVLRPGVLSHLIAQAPAIWRTVNHDIVTSLSMSEAIDIALATASLSLDDIDTIDLQACCTEPDVVSTIGDVQRLNTDAVRRLTEHDMEKEE
ncbi:MAG: hypothetical protein GX620_01915 [Chloroflexi bacterium]|nr:hypothetical protein [Chloroflexota bacterium]